MNCDIFRLSYSLRMSAEESDTAELMLYGEIIQDMPEAWKWSKEDKSAADFDKAIKQIRESGAKKLLLRINSPGGICTEAVAMRSILARAGFEEIKIRIEGLCASAATDLATLPGAYVSIAEGSEYMIHNPWTFAIGNANEMEHTIERLRNIEQMSRSFYMAKTGQTEEQIKAWMDAETWFTADEAVEYGFADEVLRAEDRTEIPAAACVTGRQMAVMKAMYRHVPEEAILVTEQRPGGEGAEAPDNQISNVSPVAGAAAEIHDQEENTQMEIGELTLEQLRDGNPALLQQIREDAVNDERQRLSDIDDLTMPGYEQMAAEAKANGTSAMDFHRAIVKASKQKGANFLQQRQQETAPAQNVAGDAASSGKSEDQLIAEAAKDIAGFANSLSTARDGGMF